jgi:hypothetical protein
MELQNQLYSQVAQAAYRSVECYEGWELDAANGLCYIQSPGSTADYTTAQACCNTLGAEILSYNLLNDVQTLYGASPIIWTDVHFDPSAGAGGDWVDKNNIGVSVGWSGTPPTPSPAPTYNCAVTDGLYTETDCTSAQEYICQESIPIVSNFDFHYQRGSSYFIASNPSDVFGPLNTGKVDVFWTRTEGQIYDSIWDATAPTNSFTLYGYTAKEGFGASLAYLHDQVIDHQLFIGAVESYKAPVGCYPAAVSNNGKVYVYHGEYTKWTAAQILLPPARFTRNNYFGKVIDADKANLHTMVVGCKGCNYTINNGAVFVYEATPSASHWSQTQVLVPSFGYDKVAVDRVRIHDKSILSDSGERAIVWRLLPHLNYAEGLDEEKNTLEGERVSRGLQTLPARWSQLQALSPATYSLSSFDVFDDTIVLGSSDTPNGAYTSVGAVYVLYPNTPDFDYHPKKPTPMQWTLHQTLFPPTPSTGIRFGKDVSIAANRMYVLDSSTSYLGYVYARPHRAGYWSLQQIVTYGAPTFGTTLEGSTTYSLVSSLTYALEVHDQTTQWGCLIVSVEDQFGDGWDTAFLTVTSEEGHIKDVFHPTCDQPNPFQFRYCPSLPKSRGRYSFSVPDAVKAKFRWEILWRIFVESTGEWIVGTWDTVIDFEWDIDSWGFHMVHIRNALSTNNTCQPCHTRPTMKPTPVHRYLKGGTSHPTISPAPTLPTTQGTVWQYLLVDGGADDWFTPSHKSTSYYISDVDGRRLLSVGTLCPSDLTTSKLCWEDLPDGEYVIRVGGALNSFSGSHTFKWCKATNPIPAQSQVVVRVEERDCRILSYFSRADYCGITLDYDIVVEFDLVISGVETDLTRAESEQITKALDSVFHGFVSCQMLSTSHVALGLEVRLNARFGHLASGYDLTNAATITSIETRMTQAFQNNQRGILAALLSGESKSNLHHATDVVFISLRFVGSINEPIPPEFISEEVVTILPVELEEEPYMAPIYLSGSGGLVLIFTALVVALMVVLRSKHQPVNPLKLECGDTFKDDSGLSSLRSLLSSDPPSLVLRGSFEHPLDPRAITKEQSGP